MGGGNLGWREKEGENMGTPGTSKAATGQSDTEEAEKQDIQIEGVKKPRGKT